MNQMWLPPNFHRMVSDLIQFLGNRKHVFDPHSSGDLALACVPEDRIHNLDGFLHLESFLLLGFYMNKGTLGEKR